MVLDRFSGDVRLAIAGYNAGEGSVEFYGYRIPPSLKLRTTFGRSTLAIARYISGRSLRRA